MRRPVIKEVLPSLILGVSAKQDFPSGIDCGVWPVAKVLQPGIDIESRVIV